MKIGSEKPKFYGSVDSKQVSWNSEGKQPSKNSGKPKDPAKEEARKQEQALREIMAFGRPNGANRAYGGGETITSTTTGATGKAGEINYQSGGGAVVGQTTFLEGRARTYQARTTIGAEAQASLVRAEYGAKWDGSLVTVDGREILGAGAFVNGEGFAGAQANAEAGAGSRDSFRSPRLGPLPSREPVPVCSQAPKGALSALA